MHKFNPLLYTTLFLGITGLAITGGDPKAVKGGQITVGIGASPKSMVYYLTHDTISAAINSLIFNSLLGNDIRTNEFIPDLAKEWKISRDKMTFTFTLDPLAKFSDGTAVTSADVKFTWETLINPKHNTAPFQSYLSSIASCETPDPQTVIFKAKTLHFKNLEKLAGLLILPRHFFSQGDFNKAFHQRLLGSGPYTLESVAKDSKIVLKRQPQYWAAGQPQNIGKFNFDRIVYKVTEDPTVAFEVFKRGDTDLHLFNIAKVWVTETNSDPFLKNHVVKFALQTKIPSGNQGFYWNLRKPLFQDLNVRMALAHLMNRERWIEDLFYKLYLPSTGILNLTSDYRSRKNTVIRYDINKAKNYLRAAGWTAIGSDAILTKGGVRFEFDILSSSPASNRYLTLYQEDLKKMGIQMNIRVQDWPAFLKLLDDRQFDAVTLARTADTDPSDFGSLWGTGEAEKKGSSNVSGFSNLEVDKLAEKIDRTFEKTLRLPMVQRIDELITSKQPYALTWESRETRVAYWNRFSFASKGYFDYSDWSSVFHYWWLDSDKETKLKAAKASGESI